jgi:hypothetical protein
LDHRHDGGENIQEATLLSILIKKSAQIQYMASVIGQPKAIVADEMPEKFGSIPTRFFESSGGHYVWKSKQPAHRGSAYSETQRTSHRR